MIKENSVLTSEKSEKYMTMLGKHFSRKVDVNFNSGEVVVSFPWGVGIMRVDSQQLFFECEGKTQESVDRVKSVFEEHVYLLKDIRGTELTWIKSDDDCSAP